MKMFKRVSAILITIAMLASMSVCVFADDAAKVQITGVTAKYFNNEDAAKDGVYTITVNYIVDGADEDTQVTMLAYVFGNRFTDVSGTTAEEFDAAKQEQESDYAGFIQGAARAIDQQRYTGTMEFKLLKAAENGAKSDKAVTPENYLLVKIGTDKAGIGSQAYFVKLEDATDGNAEEEPTTYTITYLPGDAEGYAIEEPFTVGEAYALAENTFTAPEGYEFAGWSIGGTVYPAGTSYADFTADTTVTATWSKIEDSEEEDVTYTVTYKANGGVGDDVVIENVPAGDYALAGNDFTYEGHKFIGWKVDGQDELLRAGQRITLDGNVEFLAQWVESSQGGGATTGNGMYGDVYVDGEVNDFDWMTILNHTSGEIMNNDLDDPTTTIFKAADVYTDGTIDDFDWMTILNHTSGEIMSDLLETEF